MIARDVAARAPRQKSTSAKVNRQVDVDAGPTSNGCKQSRSTVSVLYSSKIARISEDQGPCIAALELPRLRGAVTSTNSKTRLSQHPSNLRVDMACSSPLGDTVAARLDTKYGGGIARLHGWDNDLSWAKAPPVWGQDGARFWESQLLVNGK